MRAWTANSTWGSLTAEAILIYVEQNVNTPDTSRTRIDGMDLHDGHQRRNKRRDAGDDSSCRLELLAGASHAPYAPQGA
jgi:hypothetical protein